MPSPMELKHLVKTIYRGLIPFNPVRHLSSSRSLSSSTTSALKGTSLFHLRFIHEIQLANMCYLSTDPSKNPSNKSSASTNCETPSATDKQRSIPKTTKTVAQADAELRERLERMSGDGGAAGIEYEDGKPSAMKRGVRNNMFRLI